MGRGRATAVSATPPGRATLGVTVNGEPRLVAAGSTVAALVAELGCGTRGVAVALDREVVPRSAWGRVVVGEGTVVEVVTAVAGG